MVSQISLDKQIHLYCLDTGDFYYADEQAIFDKYLSLKQEKIVNNKILKTAQEAVDVVFKQAMSVKDVRGYLVQNKRNVVKIQACQNYIDCYNKVKEINGLIKQTRSSLYNKFKENTLQAEAGERELNLKALNDGRIISMFESTLSRVTGLVNDKLTDQIFVVEMYHFDIAKDIIINGFKYNGDKYVFYTASAGQIRTKKAVFINKKIYDKYKNTLLCGLSLEKINKCGGVNVNKYLAYLALTNSATDLWSGFDIDRCIVVDDFSTDVFGEVDFIDETNYTVTRKEMQIPIEHTDGCGLMLPTVCEKNYMVRLPWIKGLLASFDYKRFIAEYNGATSIIKDIYGDNWDIIKDDIRVIFTKSQFKMWKYYKNWNEYKQQFKKYKCQAGICNIEEDNIKSVGATYQMLQTLTDVTKDEIYKIAKPSIEHINNMTKDIEHMQNVLCRKNTNGELTPFKEALLLYPELLADDYTRKLLRDIKKAKLKKYRAGGLSVGGKYLFILPDLYAVCERWFANIKTPRGLLDNNEVYAKTFRKAKEVAVLRSPHLFKEWAIRYIKTTPYISSWFNTNAIYTSSYDLISKILQFDCDGDKAYVVYNNKLVNVAKRNMRDVVPLYYNMRKAQQQEVNAEDMYNGMHAAWTGKSIGIISNSITKVWNTGNIGKESELVVKLLCAESNFAIDYAKTLYQPERPKVADVLIKKHTKGKVPHFFIYAKDYKPQKVEPVKDSFVDHLEFFIKDKQLPRKRNYNFNYKILLNEQYVTIDERVVDIYNKYCNKYYYKLSITPREQSIKNGCIYITYEMVKEMARLGYNKYELSDMLVEYLYNIRSTEKKKVLWECFGGEILYAIKKNIAKSGLSPYCKCCGERNSQLHDGYCVNCVANKKKESREKTLRPKRICLKCGEEFIIKSNNSKYCDKCSK